MDYINKFLEDLVDKTGITDPKIKKETVEELEPILYDRLLVGLLTKLDKQGQDFVVDLVEKQDFEKVIEYFQRNIPDFDTEFEKLLVIFAGEYLENMKSDIE